MIQKFIFNCFVQQILKVVTMLTSINCLPASKIPMPAQKLITPFASNPIEIKVNQTINRPFK